MEANYIQQRMAELQKSEEMASVMGRLLSGKQGYKAVVEKKVIQVKCAGCGIIYECQVKFCPECGTKIDWPAREQ